jgi:hypothetical protein
MSLGRSGAHVNMVMLLGLDKPDPSCSSSEVCVTGVLGGGGGARIGDRTGPVFIIVPPGEIVVGGLGLPRRKRHHRCQTLQLQKKSLAVEFAVEFAVSPRSTGYESGIGGTGRPCRTNRCLSKISLARGIRSPH